MAVAAVADLCRQRLRSSSLRAARPAAPACRGRRSGAASRCAARCRMILLVRARMRVSVPCRFAFTLMYACVRVCVAVYVFSCQVCVQSHAKRACHPDVLRCCFRGAGLSASHLLALSV